MKAPIVLAAAIALAAPFLDAADAPHVQLEKLDATVVNLAAQKVLNSGQEKSLRAKVAHAAGAFEIGDAHAASQRLQTFVHEVQAMGKTVLPEKEALVLVSLASEVAAQIDEVRSSPISINPALIQLCEDKQCKGSGQVFVNAGARSPKPDGSATDPFRTISQAMDRARSVGLCSIEITIAPGVYTETVIVDRSLTLRGSAAGVVIEGSVFNPGGHGVVIENLALRNSPAPGAIVVPFSCSSTVIRNVVIEGATGYGIQQSGGAIEIFRAEVRETRSEASHSASGAGIRLGGGVLATLRLVQAHRNSAGGIVIDGHATRVFGSLIVVRENHINPFFRDELIERYTGGQRVLPGVAGIEVRQALLLLEWFAVEENEYFGVLALDKARVSARYGLLRGAPSLPVSRFSSIGGSGILALDEAAASGAVVPADERIAVDLSFVTSSHNEFAGFGIVHAFAKTLRGRIEHNEIGVGLAFGFPDHPELPSGSLALECLDPHGVRHNRSDNWSFAIGLLPVPCDPEFGLECPPLPPCREVPFVCDWCG